MSGYNFTDRVHKVLQFAREESVRLHHEYIGAEHVLLGLLREGEGVASAVLAKLDVDLQELRAAVAGGLKPGRPDASIGPDLPYTSRATQVLEASMTEARELGSSYVGTEHLLLGLLRAPRTPAAAALGKVGVTLERARELSKQLRDREPSWPSGLVPVGALGPAPRGGSESMARRALVVALVALAVAIAALVLVLRVPPR